MFASCSCCDANVISLSSSSSATSAAYKTGCHSALCYCLLASEKNPLARRVNLAARHENNGLV